MKPLWNFIAFQAGWFASILLAAAGRPLLGALATVPILGLHLAFVRRPRSEAIFLLGAGVLGCLCDGALGHFGLVSLTGTSGVGVVYLLWFAALWANYATTLGSSLAWLQGKIPLAIVFGAIGGPMAYYGGRKLGAVDFPDDLTRSLIAIGALWAVATPVLTTVARRRAEAAA